MDTALEVFDYITANLATIVTLAFAGIGLLSQAAALFNLSGLARVSSTLHDVVQFAAGNWGAAVNARTLVQTYRTAGPAAALTQLATLAAPAAPKDGARDGDGPVPPGAAPAALLLAVMIGSIVACAPLSARLDQATGTSLAERCRLYRTGNLAVDLLTVSFPELTGLAAVDDAAVRVLCAQTVAP